MYTLIFPPSIKEKTKDDTPLSPKQSCLFIPLLLVLNGNYVKQRKGNNAEQRGKEWKLGRVVSVTVEADRIPGPVVGFPAKSQIPQ